MMKKEDVNRRVVMCDFDERVNPAEVKKRWKKIAKQLWPGVRFRLYSEKSSSGRGLHFWAVAGQDLKVTLPWWVERPLKILLAQCLMGGDVGRERANLRRIMAGIENWNRLFSTQRISLFGRKKDLTKHKS